MSRKLAMTLTLSGDEMRGVEELSRRKGMTKTAVIRQAIRLYQLVDAKTADGTKLLLEDAERRDRSELMVL